MRIRFFNSMYSWIIFMMSSSYANLWKLLVNEEISTPTNSRDRGRGGKNETLEMRKAEKCEKSVCLNPRTRQRYNVVFLSYSPLRFLVAQLHRKMKRKSSAFSVMALRPVVACPGLSEDEVIRAEELPERASAHGVLLHYPTNILRRTCNSFSYQWVEKETSIYEPKQIWSSLA